MLMFFNIHSIFAQDHHNKETTYHVTLSEHESEHKENGEHYKKHKMSVYMGYTYIPQASHQALLVPTFGFDYSYKISDKFSVGVLNDVEIAQYMVEYQTGGGHGEGHGTSETLEREYAYVGALVLYYSPWEGWNIGVGPGIEIEKNKNLIVGKFVLEKEFQLHDGWELSPSFQYDIKGALYDTWSFGVSVGKRF